MNKIFKHIFAVIMMMVAMPSFAEQMRLGYCSGEFPEKGQSISGEKDSWCSGAIYIPASTIKTFSGNELSGIRVALPTRTNVSEIKVWLRSSLDGDNIIEKTISKSTDPEMVKGWNEVMFDEPWPIASLQDKGLYIGYSFLQKKKAYALPVIDKPCRNALFFQDSDGMWDNHSDSGTLCIEAIIEGDSFPAGNVMVSSIDCQKLLVTQRGKYEIGGFVRNLASDVVENFDVEVLVDDEKVASDCIYCYLLPNESFGFNTVISLNNVPIQEGEHVVTLYVSNVNGNPDVDLSDNTMTQSFKAVSHEFPRKILIEEFTTESCPNCPPVGEDMHELLASEEYCDRVIAVCHHSGFNEDWLTAPFDRDYLWFFNESGRTYAPGMMADRTTFRNDHTPVWFPKTIDNMDETWNMALDTPAFVSVEMEGSIDDSGKLDITVSGSKCIDHLCDNPVVNVFVVENNIAAKKQEGFDGTWIHNHVNRAVNETWGEPIVFDNDHYTYECSFQLSDDWNRDNLYIVAFLANYNAMDATDCRVMNANSIELQDLSGISPIANSDNPAQPEIFSTTGIRMDIQNLPSGLYIVRENGKSRKILRR